MVAWADAYALSPRMLALRAVVGLTGADPESRTSWIDMAYPGEWNGHPNGPFTLSVDGFTECVRIFDAQANPLVVDYEHAALAAPPEGAPAAGWVQALEVRGDHLWAQVEWTERAAAMIRAGEYRYCSPVFTFNEPDRKTGRPSVCAIDSVALTNRPFIDGQRPIALTLTRQLEIQAMPEDMPPAAAESPAEDAGALLAARLMEATGLDPASLLAALDANLEAVAAALKGAPMSTPEPAPVAVPPAIAATDAALSAQVAALSKQIQEMAPELATLRAEKAKRDDAALVGEVEAAVQAGKIHPAAREHFVALARKAPADFRALAAALPASTPAAPSPVPEVVAPSMSESLDRETRRVELTKRYSAFGLKPEEVKKTVDRAMGAEGN